MEYIVTYDLDSESDHNEFKKKFMERHCTLKEKRTSLDKLPNTTIIFSKNIPTGNDLDDISHKLYSYWKKQYYYITRFMVIDFEDWASFLLG